MLALVSFFAFCIVASIVAYRTRPQGLIASDGKTYYIWLRSLAIDHDLDFRNDYQLIFPPDPVPSDTGLLTPRGLAVNKYPVGVAVVEVPGFIVGHAIALLTGAPANGISAPYQFAVVTWLQLFCIAALWALWLALVRLGVNDWIAAILVLSAITATNLIQYIVRPTMPHGPGLGSLCFALFLATPRKEAPIRAWRIAAVGALLGLAVIIRATNVAVIAVFVPFLAPLLGGSKRNWLIFGASLTCVLLIQAGLTSALWGHFAVTGYTQEPFSGGLRGVVGTLFAARHGLFVYHPWYLLTLILTAFALLRRDTRSAASGTLAAFMALTLINGTWWAWWFGDSFGNRAFIELILPLVVTSGLWLSRARPLRLVLRFAVPGAVLLSIANAVLWTGFVMRRYPPDGNHTVRDAYLWMVGGNRVRHS